MQNLYLMIGFIFGLAGIVYSIVYSSVWGLIFSFIIASSLGAALMRGEDDE